MRQLSVRGMQHQLFRAIKLGASRPKVQTTMPESYTQVTA